MAARRRTKKRRIDWTGPRWTMHVYPRDVVKAFIAGYILGILTILLVAGIL